MNIAFDAGAIEIAKGSGIGNYTLNQFKRLIELSSEHNFFYFNVIEESSLTDIIAGKNFNKKYYYSGKDNFLRKYNGEYKELMGSIVKNFIKENKIDVFYITAPFLTSSDIGYNVLYEKKWFKDVVVVATVYDIIPYIMRDKYLASKEAYNWYMSCIDMIRWTDRQLVISNSVKNDMVKYLEFNPNKIDIIYGGVSNKYHKILVTEKEKSEIFSKFGIKSKFMMCSVSADQRKNTEGIIQAYSLLPIDIKNSYQLVIVGRVDNVQKYKAMLDKLEINEQVILTEYVTDEEIILLYNLAEIMIFPSLYEGFGLPIVEAWACETPVLASNNSSLGEITGDAGVLFDPCSKTDMARGIVEILTKTNLNELIERGKKRLSKFTWDNVASLTLNSINLAVDEKVNIKNRRKIACVFLEDEYLNLSWQILIQYMTQYFDIELFTNKEIISDSFNIYEMNQLMEKSNQYDDILYFESNMINIPNMKLISLVSGTWIVINEYMDLLVSMMVKYILDGSEIYRDISNDVNTYLFHNMSRYFNNRSKEKTYHNCVSNMFSKVITANKLVKEILMAESLKVPIYDISLSQNITYSDSKSYEFGSLLIQNLCNAIMEPVPKYYDQDSIINKILQQEIIRKNYCDHEIRKLSSTLGYACSTDCNMQRLLYNGLHDHSGDKEQNRIRIDMVTSWNVKCGIAEYTKYFIDYISNKVNFFVFPNQANNLVEHDEEFVGERLWNSHGDMQMLVNNLLKSDAKIVHLQYTEGFFTVENLVYILKNVSNVKNVVISCHNSKYLIPNNDENLRFLNKAHYVVHQEQDKTNLLLQGIKIEQIHIIPLGKLEIQRKNKNDVRGSLNIADHSPIIGSYGFLFPHKSIYEVIQAVALLKREYPNILYIACCAIYDADISKDYYNKCMQLIKKLQLEENVKIIGDFLKPEESILLLQSCDAFIMPYNKTEESASGAVRFCIAARRPIVVTKQSIFSEFENCTLQIEDNSVDNIVTGINEILVKEKYEYYNQAVDHAADESTWKSVGEKYIKLYNDLFIS
jgi:glycosyltransferase involved in cell wall biosynthesis